MATQKQIAANRRNSQKSTGPKTQEGRAAVSHNAITHGLSAARAIVLPEEQEEFEQFAMALRAEFNPQGPSEQFHMDRMIHCAWRLQRVTQIETAVLLALRQREATAEDDDPNQLGRAYLQGSGAFTNLSRHERHIERSWRAAQHEFEIASWARMTQVNRFYARNLKKFPAPTVGEPVNQFHWEAGQRQANQRPSPVTPFQGGNNGSGSTL